MKVSVISTAQQCDESKVKGKTAVIIDVLRASTTIIAALGNGANSVRAFKTVEEAREASNSDRARCVLGGERDALPLPDFDCGNSPLEYSKEMVEGKDILLSTTNGTTAVENALAAERMYIMGFTNMRHVCERLILEGNDVVFVCAGTNGNYSADDALCAGRCIYMLSTHLELEHDDLALQLAQLYALSSFNLTELISPSYHYQVLLNKGFKEDLDYCLKTDSSEVVPHLADGVFVAD